MVEKICPLRLKMIMYWENLMKFGTKLKKMLSIKFHINPVYDEKYIKAKVKTFNGVVNTAFWNDKIANESVYYIFIAVISIDSIMKMEKKIIFKFIQKNANRE